MARYQAGDHVRMIHPTEDEIVHARIIRVQFDSDVEGDEDDFDFDLPDGDLYELEYIGEDEEFEDETYGEVENSEIVELIAGPTHDARQQDFLRAEARRRAEAIGIDRGGFRWHTDDFGFFGRTIREEEPRRDGEPVAQDITELRPTTPLAEEPAPALDINSIADIFRELTGDMVTEEAVPRERPVLPVPTECRSVIGVTVNDYAPRIIEGQAPTRLLSFRLSEVRDLRQRNPPLLTPYLHAEEDTIVFKDEHNRVWVNTVQYPEMRNFEGRIHDTNQIDWMEESRFFLERVRNRDQRPGRIPTVMGIGKYTPRKKLRRKWGDMPVIKDEKHYADKKYIA